ncbi:MAG TPA: FAD/NAD(P)-binding protein, partial [Sphingomicrobium sp.]|nr:FAD/NAD(P)-binding protein [Sphingomicrobium sp.]
VDHAEARGRGIAYGTRDPAHLLNVPAGRMSAWPDEPQDFADALAAEPGLFAERGAYGDYLAGQLEQAVAQGAVDVVDGEIAAAQPSQHPERVGWRLTLDNGDKIEAQDLVLATGNGRPAPFAIPGWPEGDMVQDPWSAAAGERLREAAREASPLLLIGTGLTMADVVLTLDRLGYLGSVTAVSRRGLVPRAHVAGVVPLPPPGLGEIPGDLSDAVAWMRARGLGGDWRSAVDSLRPVSQALWESWPEDTKARFARHARPWWDVHRHRIAPQAAAVIEQWIGANRLRVIAGRVTGGQPGQVRVARRGGGEIAVEAKLAVNCTGPSEKVADSANPLLRQLLADGLMEPGELGLGVRVDGDCRAGDGLWALGPLTKGRWWEITAVPDIRVQAERVAQAIGANRNAGAVASRGTRDLPAK